MPLAEAGLQGLREFRPPAPLRKTVPGILSWACALLQSPPSSERPPAPHSPFGHAEHATPPMRFFAPTASPRTEQRLLNWPGLPHPTACASRFSQPLDALVRPVPAGLVSCQIRSWGCALQSLAPPSQPYAVSGAVALLPFRRSRRSAPLHHARGRNRTHRGAYGTDPESAPAFRALLHSGVRHHTAGGLDRRRARSSPGLYALQGSLPRWLGTAFTAPPLMGLAHRAQATGRAALQGLTTSEIGSSLSRPPTLLGLLAS
jgi:hypothetical protein